MSEGTGIGTTVGTEVLVGRAHLASLTNSSQKRPSTQPPEGDLRRWRSSNNRPWPVRRGLRRGPAQGRMAGRQEPRHGQPRMSARTMEVLCAIISTADSVPHISRYSKTVACSCTRERPDAPETMSRHVERNATGGFGFHCARRPPCALCIHNSREIGSDYADLCVLRHGVGGLVGLRRC